MDTLIDAVELDGGSFIGANLRGKLLIYRGGAIPNLAGAEVHGARWQITDEAGRTMLFLAYVNLVKPGIAESLLEHARKDAQKLLKRLPTN